MNEADKMFLIDEWKSFFKSIKEIFTYKKRTYCSKKILVAGGYGYGNTGDEAQCNATLEILTERFKDYQIVNLTPNVEYSAKEHPLYYHDFASRVLFFNQMRNCNCYDLDNCVVKKVVFLLKSALIYLNTLMVRADLPTFFINARCAKLLYELKEASLLYFCGGGYLTGKTLSRLWDGILLCRLAYIFRTPVVMSGQTIGIWNTKFNEKYAKWGFKHVKLITVRDEEFSLTDLEKIGLKGDRYFATHDDALFCEKSETPQVQDNNYLTVNFHYWGMGENEKNVYIDKINKIVDYILNNTGFNLVFIPMHSSDKCSFDDYIAKYPSDRFTCFDYDYDFRKVRRVIADSKMCITMKHHPIIFAMGENIPVISLAFSDYYVHKNLGALMQYGQEKFSINFENENYFGNFTELFNGILNNYDNTVEMIKSRKEVLKQRKEHFLNTVDCCLGEKADGPILSGGG